MTRQWSSYQQEIFKTVETTGGNLAVSAVAGSGKTTTLVEISNRLPKNATVVFLAFNKHIVGELQTRMKGVDCMTIHALGMRACSKGYPKGRVRVDQYKYSDLVKEMLDDAQDVPLSVFSQFTRTVTEIVDKARLTLTNLGDPDAREQMIDHFGILSDLTEAAQKADVSIDYLETRAIRLAGKALRKGVRLYGDKGVIDFTDMLFIPATLNLPVPQYDVVLVDEAQDLSAAQLAIVLGAAGKRGRIVAVGDRCQPAGSQVTTVVRHGGRWNCAEFTSVAIENVIAGTKVLAYNLKDRHYYSADVTGVTARPYSGDMIKVVCGNSVTRYTPNHRCVVSFEGMRSMYVVYLMRKGNQFRIGMSKVDQPSNSYTGPIARMQAEAADALWLLNYYATYQEAATMEQAIAGRFGIPQLMFTTKNTPYPELVEQAWGWIGDNTQRGLACLVHFGRDMLHPLVSKEDAPWTKSLKRPIETHASNLMTGCWMLPWNGTRESTKWEWTAITVEREHYEGLVYSIDVAKHHTYIADGIVTHNCQAIQGFAGAANDSFDQIVARTGARELPLSVCYRCPVSHLDLARQIVPHIEAAPDAQVGATEHITMALAEQMVRRGDLFLCRTNAPLVGAALKLIARGVQARVRGRNIGAGLTKMVDEASRIAVADEGSWRATFAKQLRRLLEVRLEMLQQKEHSETAQETVVDQGECIFTFLDGSPDITDADTLKARLGDLFADENAAVWLSSIHRAKGLEADNVFILNPDRIELDHKSMRPWQREQERNLHYVALTRARKALYFVQKPVTNPKGRGDEAKTEAKAETVGANRWTARLAALEL